MLFWELEPNFIAVNICLSIYFDFHLMLLNGGRDQFVGFPEKGIHSSAVLVKALG